MSEQLIIPFVVSDSDPVSITDSVSEHKQAAIQRFLDRGEKEPIACVTTYSPGKRKSQYYRLSYRQGKKVKHIHIRGGSTIAELATYRAQKLQALINRGAELPEVIAAVRTFNGG
jgi:hypothetical protein